MLDSLTATELQRGTVAFLESESEVLVDLPNCERLLAESAVPGPLSVGSRVLLAGSAENGWFVIGILGQQGNAGAAIVRSSAGAEARIEGVGPEQRIQVYDPDGGLVFEYQPTAGKLRLVNPAGDVELAAPEGSVKLSGRRGVHVMSQQVTVAASQNIRMTVPAPDSKQSPALQMNQDGIRCQTGDFSIDASNCEIATKQAHLTAEELTADVEHARTRCGRLESVARIIVESADSVYRKVRDLLQQQCGRYRTVADHSFHIRCEDALICTDRDFKVQGDRIQLG